MKLISWNVNGLRAALGKGFAEFFDSSGADVFSIQETKLQPEQSQFDPAGYHGYYHSAVKKGYSGVASFCRERPLSVSTGLAGEHADEGRVLTLEFERCFLVNCYSPNSQPELRRIDYRVEFDAALRAHLAALARRKPAILCGDLNVAHEDIDLKNPDSHRGGAGFSDAERSGLSALLAGGFTDSYRLLYPDREGAYTWWNYQFHARERNAGWRIDYFLVSNGAADRIRSADIYADVTGSDHCPVGLEIDI